MANQVPPDLPKLLPPWYQTRMPLHAGGVPVFGLVLVLTLLLAGPRAAAGPAVEDFTFAEFTAPALTGHAWGGGLGHPPVKLLHAQMIYAGYAENAPSGSDLWYSHGLASADWPNPGVLTAEEGNNVSTSFRLARPPSTLAPPYHLLGLAIPENGGLLIGSAPGVPWSGRDFNSIFPGIDLAGVIAQIRSDNLQGGAVESLLRWMLQEGVTGTSPTPISEIPVLPEPWPPGYLPPFPGGPVWGFSEAGAPLELNLPYRYPDPWNPGGYIERVDYAEWRVTGPDFLVIPESAAGTVLLPGILIVVAGMAWRRAKSRRTPAG